MAKLRPTFKVPDEEIKEMVEESTKSLSEQLKEQATRQDQFLKEQREQNAKYEQDRKDWQTREENRLKEEQRLRDEQARKIKEDQDRQAREAEIQRLADERANKLAEDRATKLAEEKAKVLAEEKAKVLAEEKAKTLAEEKAKVLAEEKAKTLAEEKAKVLAEEHIKKFREDQAAHAVKPPEMPAVPGTSVPGTSVPGTSVPGTSVPVNQHATPADASQQGTEASSKIAKMIEDIKKKRSNIPIVAPGEVAADPKDLIDCPTCGSHVHKLEQTGQSVKCVGDKCGQEFVLVPKEADYKCVDCGVPIKKPPEGKTIDSCPFCGGKKAMHFDWSKMWNKAKMSGKVAAK